MIWNQHTGGRHLLNDNYAGYITDQNTFVENGQLFLQNKKETIQGVDPVGTFEYTTGWINSLQKINFNGTQKGIYIDIRCKFPTGDKVWPAIWLIDDSPNRTWPPEIDIWEYFGKFFNTNLLLHPQIMVGILTLEKVEEFILTLNKSSIKLFHCTRTCYQCKFFHSFAFLPKYPLWCLLA